MPVFDHPYCTIPDLDGSFELTAVPADQCTLVGWHERVGERAENIRVEAGRPGCLGQERVVIS